MPTSPRNILRALIAVLVMVAAAGAARAGAATVTVAPGDTLSAIAARTGTTVAALMRENGLADADTVIAGTSLRVPGSGGASTARPVSAAVTLGAGETLGAVAARHGVSVAALAAANGIVDPNVVAAGRRLVIPGHAGRAAGVAAAPTAGSHTVRPGETLSAIAARAGTSVAAIAAANGITNPDTVAAGRVLRLPGGAGAAVAASASAPVGVYTVRQGDTLGSIAARAGTSAESLVRLNGLADPDALSVGQTLRVPGAAGTGSASAAAAATLPWVPRSQVADLLARHAARHGVSLSLVRAVAWQESGFRQDVRSPVGAMGVMQLMPDTAAWAGPALIGRSIDPTSVSDNVETGVAYLAYLLRQTGGDTRKALAGYNQGLGSVARNGLFNETKQYIASIMAMNGSV